MSPVFSAHIGRNADLIAEVVRLYAQGERVVVADVTWGGGDFWKRVQKDRETRERIQLLASDINPDKEPKPGEVDGWAVCDFRQLPYDDESVDVVVLDPPYIHSPQTHLTDYRYNNAATTGGLYHDDIIDLYRDGMAEAKRVLRPRGFVWVKGKDQVQSDIQRWSVVDLHRAAVDDLGLYARDFFVLVPKSRTQMGRWRTQYHARKNHSFLWVFEKRNTRVRERRRQR